MRIGIVVVYMIKSENEKLLELHLRQIRTFTNVSYTIYAGVGKLEPRLLKFLESEPHVKIIPLPETNLRGGEQHSFYLERLIRTAVLDDVTHIAILHVDSFPIRSDWVEIIAERLVGSCVLSTISHNHYLALYTACLCFRRDFYMNYHPEFFLTENERSSDDYRRFSRECDHYSIDSGVGFVFKAFCRNLSWIGLERSNKGEDHGWYGSIYEDTVFHLVGAYRRRKLSKLDASFNLKALHRILHGIVKAASVKLKGRMPEKVWNIARFYGFPVLLAQPSRSYDNVISQLMIDPDGYLDYLRYGERRIKRNV
ncbi:MAG: hypothetical protein JW884_00840 [Deltaproteobacteria bacterium]|nr:hypothetical protein [Deltaproteobacteria bacterium]